MSQPENSSTAPEGLRQLLARTAFLEASHDQPLAYRGGGGAPPWLLYTWNASLDSQAVALLGECLWDRLRTFQARQIASYGYTGLPLMLACLGQASERVLGLSIRSERKRHGSLRRIDGPGDRSQPVVVMDDSLVSGTSMLQAIQALEEEGYRVEGCLALVGFPHRGGAEHLEKLGYRVEILFDVYKDLGRELPQSPRPYEGVSFGPQAVPDGLPPAVAARRIAELVRATGQLPRPPTCFDRDYDGRGGVFVSLRDRRTEAKVQRLGYWLFDPAESDVGRDLVVATAMTLEGVTNPLEDLKLCVTFFGPLEPTAPADLDYWNRGVVVRSRDLPHRCGGALPNTEVFTNEWEQLQHARFRNAGLGAEEPYELLTHTLTKCLEPGESWPCFGSPRDEEPAWLHDRPLAERITGRARELVLALAEGREPEGEPLPPDLVPQVLYGVSVALYHRGLAGCGVAFEGSLEECLREAARIALHEDARYAERRRDVPPASWTVMVSLLHQRTFLGEGPASKASRLRRGMDSLAVACKERQALFLPHVSVHRSWDWSTTGGELLAKARLPEKSTASWFLAPTVSWMRRGDKHWALSMGFPERGPGPTLLNNPAPLAGYLARLAGPDGLPGLWSDPCSGERYPTGGSARRLHGLWALVRAARTLADPELEQAARRGLQACQLQGGELRLPDAPRSRLAEALLLLSLLEGEGDEREARLAADLRELIQSDGRILSRPKSRGLEPELDCLSGAVVLALTRYARRRNQPVPDFSASQAFYRRRFAVCHPWAMVGWHTQAWSEVEGAQEFVFELADFALAWQHRRSGAYLCDLDPDGFSFHTAFVAEGVARAARLADSERRERYRDSCQQAFRFMERLRLRPEDAPLLASPDFVGGVRGSLNRAEVRVDYVSHTLIAALNYAEIDGLSSRQSKDNGSESSRSKSPGGSRSRSRG
ncbi:MAG: hypothetical protein AMXMBFR33_73190 [Candidatus Xenobia bacterium]